MAEWLITAIIQGVGLVFMAGMVYKGHTRMEKDLDGKADAGVVNAQIHGLDTRVESLEDWRNTKRLR